VDMKIECGQTQAGRLLVADVIDNDSWRIWPGGDSEQMADKQLYRDGRSLDYIADRYAWVAEATRAFVLSTPE
jgi:phosphoribosylaminoimidazole-succinocarboxamide synthase